MQVTKAAEAVSSGFPNAAQLEAIRALAKAELKPEQVYVFSVKLCDDQVDRDFERFDTAALAELARLFIGKTGIVDHVWSADRQIARIFQTQVVQQDGTAYIKAWAYIRRGGSNDDIIADIEAGIKKEVSVGCAMGRAVCSVCGSDYGSCGHRKGEAYDGQLCCAILREPMDAYEFSFVAVPAQREAGVLKGMATARRTLRQLAQEGGAQEEYRILQRNAELGLRYRRELEDSVVRLCLCLELGLAEPSARSIAQCCAQEDLLALKDALSRRLEESLPPVTQLSGFGKCHEPVEKGFLI